VKDGQKLPNKLTLRTGWRAFTCYECKYRWAEPTRDRFSPSVESCPRCSDNCVPERYWHDEELQTDKFGNLIPVEDRDDN